MIITVLVWSERLLALAIIFQTIELLKMKAVWSDSGVWRWSTLRKEIQKLPGNLPGVLDFLLRERNFHLMLLFRLFCSFAIWVHPSGFLMAVLFFTTWLIAIRWRGIFNGGSDSMTALIALSLWLAQSFSQYSFIVKMCLAYIAIQMTASYFIAGYVKLKNQEWRSGIALPVFFKTPRYDSPPEWLRTLMSRPIYAKFVSYAIIVFECTFPLAWLSSQLCLFYIFLAMVFHLLTFWTFGFNRFVFAWAAGYPALYFWCNR